MQPFPIILRVCSEFVAIVWCRSLNKALVEAVSFRVSVKQLSVFLFVVIV